ncbi:mannose-1-phosphate guanylyltransferase [Muribaculaceae bacterium Isolate-104 (HZI)]|jgi:mannose-1-phosphate guanylyltransferase|nr:mannose-1-phosphate guanylyltransferase [Muribaculaceae bacterium Isolate-104 (HZI)]
MTTDNHRYCVIMCGGVGSRFWPYSRSCRPKQFIDFLGTGRTLLQMCYDRVKPLVPENNIIVVTNAIYADLVREQLPHIDPAHILLEPCRRNTAPCIAWAANHIHALDPQASMIVTPSDHLITNEIEFVDKLRKGFEFVEANNALLTLGIKPTRPETGYGYIQIGSEVQPGILKVKTFTEKPNLELAQVFVESGEFFWNSGIFLWKTTDVLEAFANLAPDLAEVFSDSGKYFGTPAENDFIKEHFPACPSISVDFAIMEKAPNVFVECVDFGWSDLGTWSALYDNSSKNNDGNVTQNCNVMTYDSSGNIFAVRDEKLVVVSGLHDYIVADAGDVLLVCPKSEEQRIKQIVNDVQGKFDEKYL